jgi:hypothetical protein
MNCPRCNSHLIGHPTMIGWLKCNCGWCQDKNGNNKLYPFGYTKQGEIDGSDQTSEVAQTSDQEQTKR